MDTFLDLMVDVLWWCYFHPRAAIGGAATVATVVGVAVAWACSNLTWVYRICTKDGEAVRVGVTWFGRYHKRMREYRTGKDSSTRRGVEWQKNVRWWTPTIPARVARWCGCSGWSETGEWPGWSRWFRTVELHRTRDLAEAYEDVQIKAVRPKHNHKGKPKLRYQRQQARRIAA